MAPNSFWSAVREKNAGRGVEFLQHQTHVQFNEGCLPHLGRNRFNWAHQGARPPACVYTLMHAHNSLTHIYIEFYKSLLASCKVLLLLVCLRQVCDKWKTRSTTLQQERSRDCISKPALRCDVCCKNFWSVFTRRPTSQTYTLEFWETF
jgi:hypothetical protein